MAKFSTTVGNTFFIEQIILGSTEKLTLVTPFLKFSKTLIERLSDAERKGIKMTLIYGKSELPKKEKEILYAFKNIKIYYCANLHAKCYFNDSAMIITSMNLYEFSERNNREMGIYIEKEIDEEIFKHALEEVESIQNASVLEKDFEVKEEKKKELIFELDPNYNDRWNFHLPVLFKLLQEKYPNHEITINSKLEVKGFPYKGINLEVGSTLHFMFDKSINYSSIKEKRKEIIKSKMPEIRFFWNYFKLDIYPEKRYVPELNIDGLNQMVDKYFKIIETVYNALSH